MDHLIDPIKKAIEFEHEWQTNPPSEYVKELATHVENVTGERFNFTTGKFEPVIALPWTMPIGSEGYYVMDADSRLICKGIRKVDAEFIVRIANSTMGMTPSS